MLCRLDKLLADGANLTRSRARAAIVSGRVRVEDEVCRDFSKRVEAGANIFLDNSPVNYKKFVYIMLNKPKDFVCSTSDRDNATVLELIDGFKSSAIFPVGRLDKDSTGLCLLTDDGELGHKITAPSTHLKKQYIVHLDTEPTDAMVQSFSKGIQLRGEKLCKPAELTMLDGNICKVSITEGKYHQIKRMFAVVGARVLELHRFAIGSLVLDKNLKLGEFRELSKAELELLKSEVGLK